MEYNQGKVDELVLALLYLNRFNDGENTRVWKSLDWDAMNHLYEKGYITNPKSKAKSVGLTEKGEKLSEELFLKYFGVE